jgi:ABC-type hemin transport system ATPase subunit
MCAGRALLLGEGRALEVGRPRDVIRADTLQRLYGVPAQVLSTEAGVHAFLPRLTR